MRFGQRIFEVIIRQQRENELKIVKFESQKYKDKHCLWMLGWLVQPVDFIPTPYSSRLFFRWKNVRLSGHKVAFTFVYLFSAILVFRNCSNVYSIIHFADEHKNVYFVQHVRCPQSVRRQDSSLSLMNFLFFAFALFEFHYDVFSVD